MRNAARSPALILQLHELAVERRDELVAVLSDYDLVAIHEDDPSKPQSWTAFFSTARARDSAAKAISEQFNGLGVRVTDVEDEDWARKTQSDLPAIQIGRVTVAPPWDLPADFPYSAARTAHTGVVVIIEPSRGFGTGHHQSTRLCLVLLQQRNAIGQTMIDVGTGSGVLAITAAKLGAAYVAAIDIDPDAIENARENIAANGVGDVVEAHVEDFTTANRPPAAIVCANLTGSLLARHASELGRFVRPDGVLIVSGFNFEENRMVEGAFASGFEISESAEEDGWCALVLSPKRIQR
jgi:ribosomal protein L11 methyltransferase